MSMDTWLAQAYNTNGASEDLEKIAQAEMAQNMAQQEGLSDEKKARDRDYQPQRCMTGIGARDAPVMIDTQTRKAERGETNPGQEWPYGDSFQALHQQQRRESRRHDQAGQHAMAARTLRAREKQNTEQQSLAQTDCQAGRNDGQREMSGGVAGLLCQVPHMNDQLIDATRDGPARAAQQ